MIGPIRPRWPDPRELLEFVDVQLTREDRQLLYEQTLSGRWPAACCLNTDDCENCRGARAAIRQRLPIQLRNIEYTDEELRDFARLLLDNPVTRFPVDRTAAYRHEGATTRRWTCSEPTVSRTQDVIMDEFNRRYAEEDARLTTELAARAAAGDPGVVVGPPPAHHDEPDHPLRRAAFDWVARRPPYTEDELRIASARDSVLRYAASDSARMIARMTPKPEDQQPCVQRDEQGRIILPEP